MSFTTAKKVLAAKFVFVSGLGIAATGVGGEFYTAHRAETDLAADYARAASCEVKTKNHQSCSIEEGTSVAKKRANEDMRNLAHGVTVAGAVVTYIGI